VTELLGFLLMMAVIGSPLVVAGVVLWMLWKSVF
jgi:hypothetical protein